MNVRHCFGFWRTMLALALGVWLPPGSDARGAQTYDFGFIPIGATNKVSGFNFAGGTYNGTSLFMALETIIGPNAADFQTSTNYTGQYLSPAQNHMYSLSFAPQSPGFESAALTNYETPNPPFGGGIL